MTCTAQPCCTVRCMLHGGLHHLHTASVTYIEHAAGAIRPHDADSTGRGVPPPPLPPGANSAKRPCCLTVSALARQGNGVFVCVYARARARVSVCKRAWPAGDSVLLGAEVLTASETNSFAGRWLRSDSRRCRIEFINCASSCTLRTCLHIACCALHARGVHLPHVDDAVACARRCAIIQGVVLRCSIRGSAGARMRGWPSDMFTTHTV
jgi:hypothetical protein